ncbi:uncharacterized protein BO95DRAFT_445066 [Aspergillus brunneoviolaceus CBS 621.78]|uniref:Uncharacterized protein n=1 Tax=Aspergillus brunneoviolaceus CBS 621.78 TaxID=1450534 RepID=A0ACD1G2I5_9EURO|nr:hypothetical protein BO95DRAFT_445066 [Aspergillus brunneoviolaceus CBS 621.78]RAH43481.1 hypothetical protein BO95DRAFT_445066 [Aspergillus brunneoviolaceus CBS 621.78]
MRVVDSISLQYHEATLKHIRVNQNSFTLYLLYTPYSTSIHWAFLPHIRTKAPPNHKLFHEPPQPNHKMPSSQDSGVTGAAKFVTSTLGNTVGGVSRTVGGVTGAAGRGIGDTITGATGSAGKPVGDALGNIGSGVEDGARKVAQGVEDAGQWKSRGW